MQISCASQDEHFRSWKVVCLQLGCNCNRGITGELEPIQKYLHPNYQKVHLDYETVHSYYKNVHPLYQKRTSQLQVMYILTTCKDLKNVDFLTQGVILLQVSYISLKLGYIINMKYFHANYQGKYFSFPPILRPLN